MATTVPAPPVIDKPPSRPFPGMPGGNGPAGLIPDSGGLRAVADRSPEPARTGIWVALAAIAMCFAALTSALIVRQGSGNDWQHILIPRILYLNSAILVLSSLTLEFARKKVARYIRLEGVTRSQAMQWLGATLALGLTFVVGQYLAWLQLRSEGLYLATNPNSSFFYVLTAVHAIHVLGGLGGLLRVMYLLRSPVPVLRKSTMDSTSYYWHFMGMLWIYLLFVVCLKL
ncbi:MAG: cytochrome c oxidase subunit 3 [Terriglobales bacterium]|jgi:cytochrome c oxidase subunit 3